MEDLIEKSIRTIVKASIESKINEEALITIENCLINASFSLIVNHD